MRRSPVALVLVAVLVAFASSPGRADESSTARRFERARASEPELIAFLRGMPKGADLHTHITGDVYAEHLLDRAIEAGLHFDTRRGGFTKEPGPDTVPARELATNSALASRCLDALSMRGCRPGGSSGHDHFFATFGLIWPAVEAMGVEGALQEVVARARAQNIQYLEAMTVVVPRAAMRAACGNPPALDDPEKALAVMRTRFPAVLAASRTLLDQRDRDLARAVGVAPPVSGTGGPINIRYIHNLSRMASDEEFFCEMAIGMALAQVDRRVASVNIVAPEDSVPARRHFDRQMEIIDFLWQRLGRPALTLHAGELTLDIAPLEVMRSRIRRTIEKGHARRIGHGVSVAWEDDVEGLLRGMRDQGIAVEICLSSNAAILGVSGDRHPFEMYRRARVPVTLNTDDEGVSRSNLTMEFVKAARSYPLSYGDLKNLARNSLEYSFLPGGSLYVGRDYTRLRPEFRDVRSLQWAPDAEALRLMAGSDRLAVQVRLERAFVEFER